jgi:cytochrome bd-type quinol oxidase subunit 2
MKSTSVNRLLNVFLMVFVAIFIIMYLFYELYLYRILVKSNPFILLNCILSILD